MLSEPATLHSLSHLSREMRGTETCGHHATVIIWQLAILTELAAVIPAVVLSIPLAVFLERQSSDH